MKSPGDDLSPADLAALRVLTDVAITNNKMVVELARTVARQRGIELPPPRSEQPRRRGKWQYSKLTQDGPGAATLEVVRDSTGEMKHFRITRDAEGSLCLEEL